MPDTTIDIKTDIHSSDKEIGKVNTELSRMQTHAAEAPAKLSGLWTSIAGGIIVARAAQEGLRLFWTELKSVVDFAAQAEQANSRLDATLFATGREAANLSQHYKDQAQALMNLSIYDDEAIKGAQTMLLQMTRLNKDGIDQATKGALGLASVFKMDLTEAARIVGNWLDGNTYRMKYYGIQVLAVGTEEEKRNYIIKQLLGYYQRVLPETETYSGKILQLKNSYRELKEEVGKSITDNANLVVSLKGVIDTWVDLFRVTQKLKDEQIASEKTNAELGNQIWEAGKKAGLTNEQIRQMAYQFRDTAKEEAEAIKELKEYGGTLDQVTKKIIINNDNLEWAIMTDKKYAAVKIELIKIEKEYAKTLAEQEKLRKGAETGTPLGPSADELVRLKKIEDERKKLKDEARKWLEDNEKKYTEYLKKQEEDRKKTEADARKWLMDDEQKYYEKRKKLSDDYKKNQQDARQWLQDNMNKYFDEVKRKSQEAKEKLMNDINELKNTFSNFFSALSDLSKASGEKRLDDLDKYYESEKEKIADSTLSEQVKADKLKVLDEKQAIDRKRLQREVAKDQKAGAVFQTIIDTAAAFMATLKYWGGTPIGWAMAALTVATGAIKLAAIKAQPLPLAQGAVFTRPTYLVGEAGAEALAPLKDIPKIARQMGGGQDIKISLAVPIYLAGHKFDEKFIEINARLSKEGRLKTYAKAIA